MGNVLIRFRVNNKTINRTIKTPKDSHDVICDLFREFDDFKELNFFHKEEWLYGVEYDSRVKNAKTKTNMLTQFKKWIKSIFKCGRFVIPIGKKGVGITCSPKNAHLFINEFNKN